MKYQNSHKTKAIIEARQTIGCTTPKPTASIEEQTETIAEFQNRLRNSSLTVDSIPIVSGDRPKERHPSHLGVKSTQGIILPFITSGAILNDVVMVQ